MLRFKYLSTFLVCICSMCMYVHVCACMCMYVHVYRYVYVCMCRYVHRCACAYIHIRIYIYIRIIYKKNMFIYLECSKIRYIFVISKCAANQHTVKYTDMSELETPLVYTCNDCAEWFTEPKSIMIGVDITLCC